MRFVLPTVLIFVAVIHALPVMGVLGATKLTQLYGINVDDPSLELLLRHRAVLFGLLAGFLVYAALRPERRLAGLITGFVSVGSFLALAQSAPSLTAGVATVVRADWIALALLGIGVAAHVIQRE
jgi:hypothetical protein